MVYTTLKLLGESFSYLDSRVPAKLLERSSTLKTPWQSAHWWVALLKDGISLSGLNGQLNVLQNPTALICYRASKALSPVWGRSEGRETRMESGSENTREEEKQITTEERR